MPPDESLDNWPHERIWDELATRFALPGWELKAGPITDASITPMRVFATAPMRHGNLFLAGDSAHIVPPTGAKGLNLALADAALLAEGIVGWLRDGRPELLDAYSGVRERHVWRAVHFAVWMTEMLHVRPEADAMTSELQRAQLRYVVESSAAWPRRWPRTTPVCLGESGASGRRVRGSGGPLVRPALPRGATVVLGGVMRRGILGGTGMSVSSFALGTMMFGAMGNTDHDESVRMIHSALDAGVNFVDTADVYSRGESEEIVGKALRGRRDSVVLATKFGLPMGADPNMAGGSPRWIKRAVEGSLRRLGTDHIDLYQMHRPDHGTDVEETLSALTDLVRAGKVRAIGSSTFPADLIVEAQWAAHRRDLRPFRTEQPRYSMLTRIVEADVLPAAQRHGMGVLTYGPLSSGWLSGRADPTRGHRASGAPQAFDLAVPANQVRLEAVRQLTKLAQDAGLPLAHLAIAFVLAHPAVTSVLIGPRRPEHLRDLLAGADVVLSDDVLDRIDEIVPPGTEVNPADNYSAAPPALREPHLRRRAHWSA